MKAIIIFLLAIFLGANCFGQNPAYFQDYLDKYYLNTTETCLSLDSALMQLKGSNDAEGLKNMLEFIHSGDSLCNFLESLRAELVQMESEGAQAMADLTVSNELMIENGQATKIKNALIEFDNLAFSIDSTVYPMVNVARFDTISWENLHFKDVPFAAVISTLNRQENDIVNSCLFAIKRREAQLEAIKKN